MTKEEVIGKLCALSSFVGGHVFHHKIPHDCFCGLNRPEWEGLGGFQFDSEILDFISKAVVSAVKEHEKIERNV